MNEPLTEDEQHRLTLAADVEIDPSKVALIEVRQEDLS